MSKEKNITETVDDKGNTIKCETFYWPNGSVHIETRKLNDELHWTQRIFYSNGNLGWVYYYLLGVREGEEIDIRYN